MTGNWCRGVTKGAGRVAVAALLLVLPMFGCTDSGPPVDSVIDLLEVTPFQVPEASSVVLAQPRAWDFSSGLPVGWSAGPAGVAVHEEENGIRLEHPDELPWLELSCEEEIDLLRHGRLNVWLRPLEATDGALYYSFTDPPRYKRNIRTYVKYPPDKPGQAYGFAFPGIDGFETGLRALRLYPALSGGSPVVSGAMLFPRQQEYLAGHVLEREWVPLGQQYRRCWRLVGPGIREAVLRLPAGPSTLRAAVGCLVGEAPVQLRLEVKTRGGTIHRLAASGVRSGEGWRELDADLGRWAGEPVTLRFIVESEDPGALILIGSPSVVPRSASDDRRPNVLLIVVDTLRADRLSLYGAGERTSPHLDRLASRGTVFTGAQAPSSWTLPSVAALLTGQYPGTLPIGTGKKTRLPAGVPTMAEGFARAGYDTGGFSANFILNPFHGYSRGFDAFYLAPFKDYTMPAGQLNRRALDWLSRRGGRPFFCYLQFMDPHSPYDPPGTDRHRTTNAATFHPRMVTGYQEGDIHPLVMGKETFDPNGSTEQVVRFYDDEISYVDLQLGRLLTALARQGLLEETVVAVLSDHGEELHDRGFWSHGYTLYQEQLHVPLILRLPPGLPEPPAPAGGQVIHTPVSLVDLLPTLFQLAGLETAGRPVSGQNIFEAPPERGLISETWAGGVPPRLCLRQGPYKYVFFNRQAVDEKAPRKYPARWIWESGPAEEELYNLDDDPGERHNLVAELPDVAQRMRQELERRFGATAVSSAGGGKEKKMDRDTEERLRALGYIE